MATKLAKAIAKEKEDKKHAEKAMPLYVWVPAFQVPNFGGDCISLPLHVCVLLQAYMMAAEASGHFDYAIGVTHMHIVMRVADKLRRDKKPQGVAVAYDRLVRCVIFSHSRVSCCSVAFPLRKDWAAKSMCEYPGWSLKKAVKDIDDDMYGRALEEFGRGAREAKDETVQPQGVRYSSAPFYARLLHIVSVAGEA